MSSAVSRGTSSPTISIRPSACSTCVASSLSSATAIASSRRRRTDAESVLEGTGAFTRTSPRSESGQSQDSTACGSKFRSAYAPPRGAPPGSSGRPARAPEGPAPAPRSADAGAGGGELRQHGCARRAARHRARFDGILGGEPRRSATLLELRVRLAPDLDRQRGQRDAGLLRAADEPADGGVRLAEGDAPAHELVGEVRGEQGLVGDGGTEARVVEREP